MSRLARPLAVALALGLALTATAQQTQKAAEKPAPAKKTGIDALADPASLTERAPDRFKVSFFTTKGEFVVEAYRDWAPQGVDRFYNLVKNGFFNDVGFFRVVPGFVVQFGLSGYPSLNRALRTARIPDDPVKQGNTRGTITFATSGKDSRTTQLFINYADNSRLDGMGFAAFGKVLGEGMKVVDAINSEYREQPSQGLIQAQGNDYLRSNFPNLDFILAAEIVE